MRLIRYSKVTPLACLLAAAAGVSMGATIPYIETFESYTTEADVLAGGWTKGQPSGVISVTADAVQGAKAGRTALADISLPVGGNYGNFWCRIVAKPELYDEGQGLPADPGTAVSVAFYINTSLVLKAWDGDSWEQVGAGPLAGVAADWRTLIIHSDYTNKKWDLYVSNGLGYLAPANRLNANPLPFSSTWNDATPRLTGLTVKGRATLDAVAMAVDHSPVVDATSNGNKVLVHTMNLPAGVSTQVGLPLEAYDDANDDLNQLVGQDLLHWMDIGDIVKIRLQDIPLGNDNFEVDTGPAWFDDTYADAAELTMGTGIWLLKPSAGIFVSFCDFNTGRVASPRLIYGTATPVVAGWNNLAWPKPTPSTLNDAGLSTGAVAGDLIYMRINGRTQRLFRSADGRWMLNGTTAFTGQLAAYEAFWYYRTTTTDRPWNIP